MKRIAIWGLAEQGEKVYQYLQMDQQNKIIAVADNSRDIQGKEWHGLSVDTPKKIVELINEKKVDTVIFALRNRWIKDAATLFRNCRDANGYMIPTHVNKFQQEYDENSFVKVDFSRPRIKQFDVNLVDHCNMKCKGCLRYSNLVEAPIYADFDRMIRDWEKMSEIFWGVERLKLMGGEPLLSPQLCDYICEARRIFPDADIMVTTNALLINDKCRELFKVMKENGVYFDISLYKPMEERVEQLKHLLDTNQVWYVLNYTKGNFYKIRSQTPSYDPDEMYMKCSAKNCHHLREGKLSVCSAPQYAHYMNERYDTQLPEHDGVYDIYHLDMDAWELDDRLSRSFESCRYCAPPVEFEWGRADLKTAKMSDWFV